MNERRQLGSGPRPATPPAPPTAGRRARLAAEGTPTPPPTEAAAGERPEQQPGRRALRPGTSTDR
ncbi:hypothetical protein OHA84_36945 [Streptomyces sp. NBC_00513]|uniref:hypothetical protein n=1 Tax=unclassified Streptomyces TaxID=2593676 RepID=UPI00224F5144|nr:hypothetical protein [Streptomyces sp. NBC_00424]MCX5078638.1 hypothetical protein [Streptomyces sp. NBC_00424]WUD39082.1 hypothetical protein OHA84_00355 [Streptomyces sp. NBC_00513]WUD45647.1 hypothetical protein OHA84_36945 [Streptomyces sp. NBC_00513]